MSTLTKIRQASDGPISIFDHRITQVNYTHFEERSVFMIVYRSDDGLYVNGIETSLKIGQITRNITFIRSVISHCIEDIVTSEDRLSIREIVHRLNERIELEVMKYEQQD